MEQVQIILLTYDHKHITEVYTSNTFYFIIAQQSIWCKVFCDEPDSMEKANDMLEEAVKYSYATYARSDDYLKG